MARLDCFSNLRQGGKSLKNKRKPCAQKQSIITFTIFFICISICILELFFYGLFVSLHPPNYPLSLLLLLATLVTVFFCNIFEKSSWLGFAYTWKVTYTTSITFSRFWGKQRKERGGSRARDKLDGERRRPRARVLGGFLSEPHSSRFIRGNRLNQRWVNLAIDGMESRPGGLEIFPVIHFIPQKLG